MAISSAASPVDDDALACGESASFVSLLLHYARHSTLQPPSILYQSEPQRSDIKDNQPFPRGSVARRDEDEQGSAVVAISQSSHFSRISEMAIPRHKFLIQSNLILTGLHVPKVTFSHMAGIPSTHQRTFMAAG